MGDTPEEVGARIRARREELGWSLSEAVSGTGLTKQQLSRIEKGLSGTRQSTLEALARKLGMPESWPAGEANATSTPASPEELRHLAALRRLPIELRGHLEAVVAGVAELAQVEPEHHEEPEAPPDELAERRELRTIRLVGSVAARAVEAEVAYDQRVGGEGEDLVIGEEVPEEMLQDHRPEELQVMRVRGRSMEAAGLSDGDLVLCLDAPIGRYRRGDVVVAWHVRDGEVVKVYAGQRGGIVHLEPRGSEGGPVNGRLGQELLVSGIVSEAHPSSTLAGPWSPGAAPRNCLPSSSYPAPSGFRVLG